MYTLDLYQIKNICRDMAELGAASYAKQTEPEKDTLSQREAYRRFGASRVKFWEQKQYIHSYRTGVAE
ncbi:MAG: hypothetical protein LBK94_06495, partial [Prevotellaceae bacterium]|nr:hypothetical protein [Prevotellaceae bacterium]